MTESERETERRRSKKCLAEVTQNEKNKKKNVLSFLLFALSCWVENARIRIVALILILLAQDIRESP